MKYVNAIVFLFCVFVPLFKIVHWFSVFTSGLESLLVYYTVSVVNNVIIFIAVIILFPTGEV